MNRQIPPLISELPISTLPEMSCVELSNGMSVMFYNRCDNAVANITVITEGGIAEASTPAVAILAANMQREGTDSMSGAEIADFLDYNGAWIKSSASSHHTQHTIYTLRNRLSQVLPIFAEMVFCPSFPEPEFVVRREALARNIEVSQTDVSYRGRCRSEKMIMGETHPLSKEDYPDKVRTITADDLRRFHGAYTEAKGVTIIVCADTTDAENKMIIDVFSKVAFGRGGAELNIQPFNPIKPGFMDFVSIDNAMQSSVNITLPAVPRSHPDFLPLHLTLFALGGYFGSRLMLNIREEKGFTYGISSSLLGYIDGSYVDISAETDNANVWQLIEEVRYELRNLAENPCCGDELMRVKQCANTAHAATLDSPLSIASYYATAIQSGLPDGYFNDKQKAIAALTTETISEMALKYLRPEYMRIAIAGNQKNQGDAMVMV